MTNTNQTATTVAETVKVKKSSCIDVIEASEMLNGEKAIKNVFYSLEDPNDEVLQGNALFYLMQFYTRVCNLVDCIHEVFGEIKEGGEL